MKKNKETEISLGRCFSCHKNYIFNLMQKVIIIEPEEDGIIKVKRFLCPACYDRLKEFKFVLETELERKEIKKEKKEAKKDDETKYYT